MTLKIMSLFRAIPSMDNALQAMSLQYPELYAALPRPVLRELSACFFDLCRDGIRQGQIQNPEKLELPNILPELAAYVSREGRPNLRRVLNATGVVVHTNLGRALLAEEAVKAVTSAAAFYSNLEFNLQNGERGSRYSHVEELITKLTGAEAALVVNNNAAAVLLILDTLARGREVVVSRGELVEIGGSFRIPAVMEKSGCILREVGTTNRTHAEDYRAAITPETAALLKVHSSNYRIIGFHSEASMAELAALAAERRLPLINDLGSGNLFDFAAAGFPHLAGEPTAAQVLREGADIVSFSGDKILGGPQAGIIAGKKELIEKIKQNHLTRALRIDKLTLAALEATLRIYLDPKQAGEKIPTLRMLCQNATTLRRRARKLLQRVKRGLENELECGLIPGFSRAGGGSFPEKDLPTTLLRLSPRNCSATKLREALFTLHLPLILRLEDDALLLDPRTLDDREFTLAVNALQSALASLAKKQSNE